MNPQERIKELKRAFPPRIENVDEYVRNNFTLIGWQEAIQAFKDLIDKEIELCEICQFIRSDAQLCEKHHSLIREISKWEEEK